MKYEMRNEINQKRKWRTRHIPTSNEGDYDYLMRKNIKTQVENYWNLVIVPYASSLFSVHAAIPNALQLNM